MYRTGTTQVCLPWQADATATPQLCPARASRGLGLFQAGRLRPTATRARSSVGHCRSATAAHKPPDSTVPFAQDPRLSAPESLSPGKIAAQDERSRVGQGGSAPGPSRSATFARQPVRRNVVALARAASLKDVAHAVSKATHTGSGLALSPREKDVIEMASEGLTNAEIARRLGVTEHAVKFHLAALYRKLGAVNRTEAATMYVRSQQRAGVK